MYTKQEIILKYHREGKSQRQICRELKISRKTVRRYLSGYESHVVAATSPTDSSIGSYLISAPVYTSQNRGKRRLTPEIQEAIDELLLANQQHKEAGLLQAAFEKERHTGTITSARLFDRVHQRLQLYPIQAGYRCCA